jgi:hypothetical protein
VHRGEAALLVANASTEEAGGGGRARSDGDRDPVTFASAKSPYLEFVGQMLRVGRGLGSMTAAATESIMGSQSVDKAKEGGQAQRGPGKTPGRSGVAIELDVNRIGRIRCRYCAAARSR